MNIQLKRNTSAAFGELNINSFNISLSKKKERIAFIHHEDILSETNDGKVSFGERNKKLISVLPKIKRRTPMI